MVSTRPQSLHFCRQGFGPRFRFFWHFRGRLFGMLDIEGLRENRKGCRVMDGVGWCPLLDRAWLDVADSATMAKSAAVAESDKWARLR